MVADTICGVGRTVSNRSPSSDQVGAVAVLTNAGSVSGTDSWTTKTITDTFESLTSDVPNDPQAAGEGKIIP
jgi:hypothetical protein